MSKNPTTGINEPPPPKIPVPTPVASYPAAQTGPLINAVAQDAVLNPTMGTVAGQINTIIGADSPLMQQAKTTALQDQNARGTLNSSMAIGAGQDATYRAALPIATSDARAYNDFSLVNAAAQNNVSATNAAAANQQNQFNTASTNTQLSSAAADTFQQSQTTLNADIAAESAKVERDFDLVIKGRDAGSKLWNDYLDRVTKINADGGLDGPNKQKALDDALTGVVSGLNFWKGIDGLDLSEYFDMADKVVEERDAKGADTVAAAEQRVRDDVSAAQLARVDRDAAAATLPKRQADWDVKYHMARANKLTGNWLIDFTRQNGSRPTA